MEETVFLVIGITLVVIAVVVSVIGLRNERFPGSRLTLVAGAALLVVVVAATTTSAVINAREEQRKHNEEAAAEEQETATEATEAGESPKELEQQGAEEAGRPVISSSRRPRTARSRSTPTCSMPPPAR
jgi:TctA family transporter